MEHVKLLIGWDSREAVGSHVFLQSVVEKCSLPVDVTILTPKILKYLGVGTDGTNAFSKARFLAPYLNGYVGRCIFLDGADMLALSDLADLWSKWDPDYAVQVVKHDYTPRNSRKYIGTSLEATNESYPRKNWSSLIYWTCSYSGHRVLTPEYINKTSGSELHRFKWLPEDRIGDLERDWNYLISENGQAKEAKIAHWTNGIPGFDHYSDTQYSEDWKRAWHDMNKGLQYQITSER